MEAYLTEQEIDDLSREMVKGCKSVNWLAKKIESAMLEKLKAQEPEIIGSERYRVEKTGHGFWPYCVRVGTCSRELFVGYQKQCTKVANALAAAFEDGKFVATTPLPPADVVRDAGRYRFLRDEAYLVNPLVAVVWKRNDDRDESEWVNTVDGYSLDCHIDAVMKGGKA